MALLGTAPVWAAYQDEVLADKPVGYWRLGEAAPKPPTVTAANRGSLGALGNGTYLRAVALGQPGALAGSADTAAQFDGGTTAMTVPYAIELNSIPPFTVEAWVKPNVALTGTTLTCPLASLRRVTPAAEGWIFYQAAAGWNFRLGDSANNYTVNLTATEAIAAGTWYHLAATYDGSSAILYVNGAEKVRKDNEPRYAPNPDQALGIGARGDRSFWFNGVVDEVAVYTKVLTPAQIADRYAQGLNAAPTTSYDQLVLADAPVGYWRLNEAPLPAPAVAANLGSLGASANGTFLNGASGGAPGALLGDSNTAARFEGDDDKVEVPFNAALNGAQFSFECWAKVAAGSVNHRSPVTARDDGPQRGYIFYATPANNWEFWTGTGGGWHSIGGGPLFEETWTHLVGTYDGKIKRFYVDGVFVGQATTTVSPNTQRPLRIGAGASENPLGNYFFAGDVDEVAVYDTVLPAPRVYNHFKMGGGQEPFPVFPVLVSEPAAQDVFVGRELKLQVTATGSLPFQYTWKKNGVAVGVPNADTLTIASAALTDTGTYTVEVSNAAGAVETLPVQVNVLDITVPVITQQPRRLTLLAGGTARFTVVATGSPNLTYQWQYGGSDLPNETNATLVLPGVSAAQAGLYRVRVTSEAGSTLSDTAELVVNPPPPNSYVGVIMADQPVAYWRLGELTGETAVDVAGGNDGAYLNFVVLGQPGALVDDPDKAAGFLSDWLTMVEVPYTPAVNSQQFTVEAWAKVMGGAGAYRSPLTSRDDQPQRGYIFYATPGDVWQFWTGTGAQVGWNSITGPAVEYDKWTHLAATYDGTTKRFYVNGAEVGNNTSAYGVNAVRPLRIGAGATDSPDGNFFFYGDVDEVAVFNKALPPERVLAHFGAGLGSTTPPTISLQPVSQAVLPGATVTFSVAASGSLPLNYQWQFKGANLDGQTEATLTVANAQAADSGEYRVRVSNLAGSILSDPANLEVVTVPEQPYATVVLADGPVAYWRLGESSGDVAVDEKGLHPGTYLNSVLLGQAGALVGDPNLAAGFSAGLQTKVDVEWGPDLNDFIFSVECWAKVTGGAGNYRSPVTSRADLPQRGYIFYAANNNTWQFWTGRGDSSGWDNLAGPAVVEGQWVHLVGTYDGTVKRFYVNGAQVGSRAAIFGQNDASPLRIGGGSTEGPGNYFFEGSVDEVAYYNKALTPRQVLVHYALGAKPSEPPTLSIERVGNDITLRWTNGALEGAPEITGAWTPVTGASPLTLTPTAQRQFYRVRR